METVAVGDRYLVSLFRLIGIDAVEASDDESAAKKVEELVYGGQCKIVFVTEKVAFKLKSLRESLIKNRRSCPVFAIIPDFEGPLNERTKELHQLVSQAVGVKLKIGD